MRKAPIHWTAASSAKCEAGSPPGNRVSMQSSTMCDIVLISPQLQRGSEDCFQRTMLAAQRPCPVLKRFSSTHSLRGSSWPGGQTDGMATRQWFTTSVADHSAHQADRAVMSSAGWLHHVGRLYRRDGSWDGT